MTRYLPFLSGKYSTAPALVPMANATQPEDKLVFQINDNYEQYLENKRACRKENIYKYYCEKSLWQKTISAVNGFILHHLIKEYPTIFTLGKHDKNWQLNNLKSGEQIRWNVENELMENDRYLSLFDALCSQVQEDLAVCQMNREYDWLAALHLCAPNHWAAEDKIGKPFSEIHMHVPDMEKTLRSSAQLLPALVQKGPFTRFAWGIATDTHLNHHPVAAPNTETEEWQGRKLNDADQPFYIRTERQNLVGFPGVNAFLFTIRTYFYEISSFNRDEKTALLNSINSMSAATLAYKGLNCNLNLLKEMLAK